MVPLGVTVAFNGQALIALAERAYALVNLTLSRKALLGKDVEASQALKLAANAIGLDRIELAQVVFADATTWNAERNNCVYHADGNMERAEAR